MSNTQPLFFTDISLIISVPLRSCAFFISFFDVIVLSLLLSQFSLLSHFTMNLLHSIQFDSICHLFAFMWHMYIKNESMRNKPHQRAKLKWDIAFNCWCSQALGTLWYYMIGFLVCKPSDNRHPEVIPSQSLDAGRSDNIRLSQVKVCQNFFHLSKYTF